MFPLSFTTSVGKNLLMLAENVNKNSDKNKITRYLLGGIFKSKKI